MDKPVPQGDLLARARQAFKQNNAAGLHLYFAAHLQHHPDDGPAFTEYLGSSRSLAKGPKNWVDLQPAASWIKLLPGQAAQKVYETCLERLRTNPFDLDAVDRIGRLAQNAGWNSLLLGAFSDVLRNSPAVKASGSKLAQPLKLALGKAHFAVGNYPAALDMLKRFEHDPNAPKEVAQMIKDAAASIAARSFAENGGAHKMATAESVSLATQSAEERAQTEIAALECLMRDPKLEPGKLTATALKLAELHTRANRLDQALALLLEASRRVGFNGELEKKRVELELLQRTRVLEQLAGDAASRSRYEQLLMEQQEFAVNAFSELAQRIPSDPDVQLQLGQALFQLGVHKRSESALKSAIAHLQFEYKTDEQINDARILLARSLMALELPAAAELVLVELLPRLDGSRKNGEHYLEAQYLLGVIREKVGDRRGAMSAYVTVISRNINYRDSFERVRRLNLVSGEA